MKVVFDKQDRFLIPKTLCVWDSKEIFFYCPNPDDQILFLLTESPGYLCFHSQLDRMNRIYMRKVIGNLGWPLDKLWLVSVCDKFAILNQM